MKKTYVKEFRIYPVSQHLEAHWFIKYQVPCYNTGKWVWKKFNGLLNLLPTVEARLTEAERYRQILISGQPLPIYKGLKAVPAPDAPVNFANTVQLLHEAMEEIQFNESITRQNYESKVRKLHSWLHQNGYNELPIGQLDVKLARHFLRWLQHEKRFKNQTCNHYKSMLAALWDELIKNEVVGFNPWRQFKGLPKKNIPFRTYPQPVQEKLRATLPEENLQLWLAGLTVYYDFIRPAELRRLKLHHIEWDLQCFRITPDISKCDNDRLIVIPSELYDALIKHGYHKQNPEHYLFTAKGTPGERQIGKNWFNRKFKDYRERNAIPDHYKFYGLKHTGNSRLGVSGINAQTQQAHNRHESSASIKPYNTGMSAQDMAYMRNLFPKLGAPVQHMYNDAKELDTTVILQRLQQLEQLIANKT